MRRLIALALGLACVRLATARSIEVAGYLARYDAATVDVWPERLQLLMGRPDVETRLVHTARRRAEAARNPARFFFYASFSSLDGRCGCWESDLLDRLRREHPEFVLTDEHQAPISTFLDQLPAGRQLAVDVGNPAYVDWWADRTLEEAARGGWDGVFADNIVRGEFADGSWSATPVNPRTHRPYTTAEYRTDMLAALRRLRARYDRAGRLVIGNPGAAWRSFDDDPVVRDQTLALHGVEVEDFAYDFRGRPQSEADWLRQLRYLDMANRHDVLTWVGGEGLMHRERREYVLASYLLTRRGRSVVGDLNALRTWWPVLAIDLGEARGDFYCLDASAPANPVTPCPATGRVVAREFVRARVLVNPGARRVLVPLGGTFRGLDGDAVPDPVPLEPASGRVLLHGRDDVKSDAETSNRNAVMGPSRTVGRAP